MSDPHHVPPVSTAVVQVPGEDGIQMGKIVGIGIVSLVIFALSALIAHLVLKNYTAYLRAETGEAPRGRMIGKPEIGIVDQVHFDDDHRLEIWRAARNKHLSGYGWVDHARGVVHVPIDKAMDQVVKQAGGAP